MQDKQSTNKIFMVEPEVFFMNPQTASSNHYQVDDDSISTDEILKQAKEEFNTFKNALTKNGVSVLSMKGSKECPDHIFPNWFITFENKTFQIFSMLAENRRKEKTPKMIEKLSEEYELTCDLSSHERRNIFLTINAKASNFSLLIKNNRGNLHISFYILINICKRSIFNRIY